MVIERLKLIARRVLAWWIDAFAVASAVLAARWAVNAATGGLLTGRAGELYDIIALGLAFYAYKVACEATRATTLGKWSLRLEVITGWPDAKAAAVRNSWLLLTMLAATGLPFIEPTILGVLGLSMLFTGRHLLDMATASFVEPRL